MKQPIYLIVGTPGSGKTWVMDQLKDKFDILRHDDYGEFKYYAKAIYQLQSVADKPILIETPFSVSQFMAALEVTPVFIIESDEVTRTRYETREGKPIPKGHLTRIQTYIDRAEELNAFSGTSAEVLAHLQKLAFT